MAKITNSAAVITQTARMVMVVNRRSSRQVISLLARIKKPLNQIDVTRYNEWPAGKSSGTLNRLLQYNLVKVKKVGKEKYYTLNKPVYNAFVIRCKALLSVNKL